MTLFENRERGFEHMFIHDEEVRFRALAKRNRMLGQWAADQLGLTGQEAGAYVRDISGSLMARVVDGRIAAKIRADFDASGVETSDEQIHEKMSEFLAAAIAEVRSIAW
jgi:hypothetical protein